MNVNSVVTSTKSGHSGSFAQHMYLTICTYTITLYDKIKISRYEYTTKLDGSHNIYSQVIEKIDQNIHWKNPVWLQKLHYKTSSTIWRRVIHGRIWRGGLILIF